MMEGFTMRDVFKYLGKYKLRIIIGLSLKLIGTTMDLIIPWLLSYIIDYVVPLGDFGRVFLFGSLMILCSVICIVGNISGNRIASKTAMLTTQEIRHDLFSKIQNLSSSEIDELTIPSLVSRMSNDTYNVHSMLGMIQRMGIRAPILLLGGIIVTLILDPILSLVLISTLPLIGIIVFVVTKKGVPLYQRLQRNVDKLTLVVRENIQGVRVIKALSKEDFEKERFNKINEETAKSNEKASITMGITNPILNFILNCGLVSVILVGAFRVNDGYLTSGKIIAFTTYFTIILNAMISITRMFIIMSKASASASRMSEVLHLENPLKIEKLEYMKSDIFIEFRNVTFSYGKKTNTLENISFKLNKGESLGIIGPTGAGKSTIIALLLRFYDVDSGEILIYGKNIKSYSHKELREMFGTVFQNDYIASDTIYNNIDFMRNCEYNDVLESAKKAQASEFINQSKDGFQTNLSARGTNISGGQKQRILIARALANKPQCLILDDSSSALDYKTDALLRAEINNNHTTSIIIAQRISSVMNCNHILVLEEGKMIGYGKHNDLLDEVPLYAKTSKVQLGGGICEQ